MTAPRDAVKLVRQISTRSEKCANASAVEDGAAPAALRGEGRVHRVHCLSRGKRNNVVVGKHRQRFAKKMEDSESVLGYILSGFVFYLFGLKWCYEYAKYWLSEDRSAPGLENESEAPKLLRFSRNCQRLLRRHPLEGTLKLLATAFGLASTLTGSFLHANNETVGKLSPKDVHATIYLFFALSGLVDVLNFYFPNIVGDGLTKMALAQAFFVEGFLFLWGSAGSDYHVSLILAYIVWTTSFAIVLELIWPETKLLRSASTLLHATWLAHNVRTYKIVSHSPSEIALTFSWHFAAAFVVTLIVVSVTRSCAPKLRHNEPPEIPIYDYCHELPDQRV